VLTEIAWHILQIQGTLLLHKLLVYGKTRSTAEIVQMEVYFLNLLKCAQTNRNSISVCRPTSADPAYQLEIFDFSIRGWNLFVAVIYIYYIEIFFYVCIGAAQISSMGDLAI